MVFGDPKVRLFATSATLLFVELLLIRWVPANVVYVGFFNNFLLLASFLGIGLGILLGRRVPQRMAAWFPVMTLCLASFVVIAQVNIKSELGDIWLATGAANQIQVNVLVLPGLLILTTAAMALLAIPLGPALRAMPPLRAYAFDIAGSMFGIALFAGVSLAGLPPSIWFSIAGVLAVVVTFRSARWPQFVLPLPQVPSLRVQPLCPGQPTCTRNYSGMSESQTASSAQPPATTAAGDGVRSPDQI